MQASFLCGREELGLQVADSVPLVSSQVLPFQVTPSILPTTSVTVWLWEPTLPGGTPGQKPLERPSASDWDGVSMLQLPCPSGGKILRHVSPAASQRSPVGLPPVAHSGNLLGDAQFMASFPSLLLPAIISQINYLPSNSHLRICFR